MNHSTHLLDIFHPNYYLGEEANIIEKYNIEKLILRDGYW
jgi:hypothetical protein